MGGESDARTKRERRNYPQPLYHLPEREDRLVVLTEAARVLKKGGVMIISAISRFGSTLWGLSVYGNNNALDDGEFTRMIEQELADGQHVRPDKYPHFIARAFFHLPSELHAEIAESGLKHEKTVAVEGPIWIAPGLAEKWEDSASREKLLHICQLTEEQESLIGMSPHFLAIAQKR